jgi:malonyl-CoA O-methyltransferase
MKLQIRNAFNRASASYEQSALVQKKVAGLCADLVPRGNYPRVVEIGAGAGFLAVALLPRIQTEEYVALDIAEQMVQKEIFRTHPALIPIVGDGEKLPFSGPCVDLLVSSSAMQWYLEPDISIPNNVNLLRPGGRFIWALFVRGTLAELADVSARTGFGSVFPLQERELYERILEHIPGIGFTLHTRSLTLWYDSVADFLRAHRETGARYSAGRGRVGRRAYMEFCRVYEAVYGRQGRVPASYETVFIEGWRR